MIERCCKASSLAMSWFVIAVVFASPTVFAADRTWISTTGGTFSDNANWFGGLVPGGADTVVFNLTGETLTVDFIANITNEYLWLYQGKITFDLSGNTYALTRLGGGAFGTGAASIMVGDSSGHDAALTLMHGTLQGVNAKIGNHSNSQGQATVTGSDAIWMNSGSFVVGNSGTGKLTIENGGSVTNEYGHIAGVDGSGEVLVTGANSTWNNRNFLLVGSYGTGKLTIENGGSVTNENGYIGIYNGSGEATVTGTDSIWANTQTLFVASSGNGKLTIENGGKVTSTLGFVGLSAAPGEVIVTGTDSAWVNSGALTFGYFGTAKLTIENGGTVTSADGYLGLESGSGEVAVTGDGSTWNSSTNVYVGGNSTQAQGVGLLNVSQGGKVIANGGDGNITVWATGTLIGSGGTVLGNVINHGELAPGTSPGILEIHGNYVQEITGNLEIEIAGLNVGTQHDQLVVTSNVSLNGTLTLRFLDLFTPSGGDFFHIMQIDGLLSGNWIDVQFENLSPVLDYSLDFADGLYTLRFLGDDSNPPANNGPAPEPTTGSLLALGVLLAMRRRRMGRV